MSTLSTRPAEVAGDEPQRQADREGHRHREEPRLQRHAAAVDDAAQDVAPDVVGAEEMLRGGRGQDLGEVGGHRIVGAQDRRQHGDDHEHQHEDGAHQAHLAAAELAQRDGGEAGAAHQCTRIRGSRYEYVMSTTRFATT
jgi:hypothetical protein